MDFTWQTIKNRFQNNGFVFSLVLLQRLLATQKMAINLIPRPISMENATGVLFTLAFLTYVHQLLCLFSDETMEKLRWTSDVAEYARLTGTITRPALY